MISSTKLNDYKLTLKGVEGQYIAHKKQYDATKKQVESLHKALHAAEKALVIAQDVAQKTQQEIEFKLSDIVTSSLEAVFDDPYEFKIRFDIKRNKTEANLFFTMDGHEIDPMTASGGGVVEIAALILRIACYLISTPRPHPVLILDEIGKSVSACYRPKFAELLNMLSTKLGIQIIMITHMDEYVLGNVIEIGD